ncbi:hypothetical protein ACJ5H2_17775 [Nocardioides sp. R1-1]|uniref:hypothetical protein n=1 Tax=Nocardioides sp. R1-1 TaxID=3383502 RepID=UPI0038CF3B08
MAEVEREERKPPIDWPATVAGAAAAVTVAVLLSTLGAAGTLIGAALGSVIATVSTALYKQGIESSRRRMAEVQAAALQRVNLADQSVRRAARRSDPEAAGRELGRAHRHLEAAGEDLAPEPTEDGEGDTVTAAPPSESVGAPTPGRWRELPWKRIAVVAAAIFVLALLVISAVELIAGKSVSTITGGTDGDDRTSLTGVFGDGGNGTDERPDRDEREIPAEETPTPTPTPTDAATTAPTGSAAPSETPTSTGTPSPTATVTVTETASPSAPTSPTATASR